MLSNEKATYYKSRINDCVGDQKALFSIANELMHRGKPNTLPEHESSALLAEEFSGFFIDKIDKIRQGFGNVNSISSVS